MNDDIIVMNQNNIEQRIFRNLKILDCSNNNMITNICHLADTLRELSCWDTCGIDQSQIYALKYLKILHCDDNQHIKDVNHLADTLEILNCYGKCGIDQSGMCDLKCLRILICENNKRINDVNHLANTLKILNCSGKSGIDQVGISRLRCLEELDCSRNMKITDVNHLANTLKILDCSEHMTKREGILNRGSNHDENIALGIGQEGISGLKILEELYCSYNDKIKDVNHLAGTLNSLDCGGMCGIEIEGISQIDVDSLNLFRCPMNFNLSDLGSGWCSD